MAVYERTQVSTLLSRLNEKPQRLTIVTGPRQTGKTTLVQQVLGQLDRPSHYVSVDEPDSASFALSRISVTGLLNTRNSRVFRLTAQ